MMSRICLKRSPEVSVAQSVKHLTLGFGPGPHELGHEIKPCIRLCTQWMSAWIFSLSAPSLSLKLIKKNLFKNYFKRRSPEKNK